MIAAVSNGKAAYVGDRHRKPPRCHVIFDSIPDGIRSFDRWVLWRWKWALKKDGKGSWTKVPINARNGDAASSTDPATWSTFERAIDAYNNGCGDGIGFMLGEGDCGVCFAGFDLDDCRNRESGELTRLALDVLAAMDSYSEISPTETGIKGLCLATLPAKHRTANSAKTIEVYTRDRFFVVTGNHIEQSPPRVESRQQQLTDVWQRYIGSERPTINGSSSDGSYSQATLAAMLRVSIDEGENDGSKRCYTCACRVVGHDLTDSAAWATFDEYQKRKPFPKIFNEAEFLNRIRDAEQQVERGSEVIIANYTTIEVEDDEGETKTVTVPRSMTEIIDLIKQRMNDWPRRVDSMLFVDDRQHGLDYFDRRTTAALFGWLRRHNKVQWAKGGNLVSQAELFAEIERTTRRYDAIEVLPHEPAIAGIYYRGVTPKPGPGGHLGALLDRFRPETTVDRDLIQAAMMTAFWGGLPGCRPAFVVTSDDGRGVGKTKVAETVGYLCNGYIDVSAGEDIETLKTRMLTPATRTKRIALLDNVKTLKLSWAELESMITSPVISGRQLYVGEGQRPNLLTWFITLNGVSMATDMAQRSVIIKIVKGKNDGPWWEQTRQFIDDHREQIVGDIIGALRAERFPLTEFSRWATWEKDVLCRLPEPGEAQKLILERQGQANCELDEVEIIEDFFAEQLSKVGYCPNTAQVRIPVAIAARWYGWAINEPTKTAAASKRLNQMAGEGQMKRISPDPSRSYGRCFIWTGPAADVVGRPIANDLASRIATYSQDRQDA